VDIVKSNLLRALVATLCLASSVASADDDDQFGSDALTQQVHELFLTESVFSNERGEYQPFVAADYQRYSRDSWRTLLDVGLEYGITDRLQVSASIPWAVSHDSDAGSDNGVGDFSAEVFYSLIAPTAPVAVSFAAELVLATGDDGRAFGEGEEELELTMIMAGRAMNMQWQLNLGGEWTEEEGELLYSLAVLPTQQRWKIVPTLELSGAGTDADREFNVTPGLHWRPAENAGLGFGMPIGLTGDTDHLRVLMYYTVEF
jgi:hypothetical protein